MNNTYEIYLISDSTGETLDRIFLALKAQFKNIEYKVHQYSFTRTENQILKIIDICKKKKIQLFYIQLLILNLLNFYYQQVKKKKYLVLGFWGILFYLSQNYSIKKHHIFQVDNTFLTKNIIKELKQYNLQ